MTIKPRNAILNPNYFRFYSFSAKECSHCQNCPARTGGTEWEAVPFGMLGNPIHTNWHKDKYDISTVYVCESPSNKETSHSLPSVGKTGQGIYKAEIGEITDGWLDVIDEYVYRTNIVRCQADAGLNGRVDSTYKNKRVKVAFGFCKKHLTREFILIFAVCQKQNINKLKIVLAIGKAFGAQEKEVNSIITKIKRRFPTIEIDLTSVDHPSA